MKKDNIKIKQIIVCVCILAAGICYLAGRGLISQDAKPVFQTAAVSDMREKSEGYETSAARETSDISRGTEDEGVIPPTAPGETAETLPIPSVSRDIFVHVCGEVNTPGVYRMEEGSRIYEALKRAGGYTDDAASDFLNMAQLLEDGMKITVPDRDGAAQMTENSQDGAGVTFSGPGLSVGAGTSKAASSKAGSLQTDSSGLDAAKVNINAAGKEQLMTLKGIGEARAEDILTFREQNGPFGTIEDIMKVSGIKEAAFQKIKESITV